MENNNYYNLGINILGLRRRLGISQTKMADDLEITKSALSKYENGERIPERDILRRIAKYFKITENELINGDYYNIKKIDFSKINISVGLELMKNSFPLFVSDEALENEKFKKAYEIQKRIYDDIFENLKNPDEKEIDLFVDIYKQLYKQEIPEVYANMLSWISFKGFLVYYNTPVLEKIENVEKLSNKEIVDSFLVNKQQDDCGDEYKIYKNEIKNFIKETEVDFFANIAWLKRDINYSDLADYYICLRYMCGLFDNDLSVEMNVVIAKQLMLMYDIIGNKYVKNFFSYFES